VTYSSVEEFEKAYEKQFEHETKQCIGKKKEFLENIIRSEKAQIKLNHSKFKVTKFNEIKNNAKKNGKNHTPSYIEGLKNEIKRIILNKPDEEDTRKKHKKSKPKVGKKNKRNTKRKSMNKESTPMKKKRKKEQK
jgi:hypothetical protein